MRCTRCNLNRSMAKLNFKPTGNRILGSIPEYDAVCDECITTIVIDETSKDVLPPATVPATETDW